MDTHRPRLVHTQCRQAEQVGIHDHSAMSKSAFHAFLPPPALLAFSALSSPIFSKPWREWYRCPIEGWVIKLNQKKRVWKWETCGEKERLSSGGGDGCMIRLHYTHAWNHRRVQWIKRVFKEYIWSTAITHWQYLSIHTCTLLVIYLTLSECRWMIPIGELTAKTLPTQKWVENEKMEYTGLWTWG